ncbi:helix-turn-helix domain-containing protein [Pseudoflavitalea sp. G-6-1-2]|uniref:pentapeptide repeat-containing protein n=1 Tax=Pseudoflavitalea sp. G-6-1-2 TaxID=2728841 RepID=UPI00146DEA43|nr:pentapeptide repeat-containing protein [Pseudoflavitalea sp. G-6-1-2]NML21696.1 helix-turn-helix domain-containing protein [Pseudoflavitalea sp. G-6-1-2]
MDPKLIGSKIAKARKETNMSQAQLAQQLFISPQAVGKWERGESIPDIITFNRLAEILGVDLNYFSVNFPSAVTGEPSVPQMADIPSANPESKLNWNMSNGNWVDADFSGLKGLHEKFSSSNMQRCKFIGSDLSGLLLKSNMIVSCDFTGSVISNSQIQRSHFSNNVFKDCILRETSFSGSYIAGCDFSGADLTGANFKSSGLQKGIFVNALLKSTVFNSTNLDEIVFDGTIQDCSFDNCSFSKVTFQNSMLINTFFKCRTLKHLRFADCHADRITYEFLKSGKADLSGITLLNS